MSRVAVITGASGGIGKEVARQFAADGTKVVVNYFTSEKAAEELAREINGTSPDMAFACKADLSKYQEVEAMVQKTLSKWGQIHVLINSATGGPINTPFRTVNDFSGVPIVETEERDWDWIVDATLKNVFNCIKAIAPQMMKQKEGHIISVGAAPAIIGREGWAAFNAAKGGLIALSRSAARELGKYNIKVNIVNPGYIAHPGRDWEFSQKVADSTLLKRFQTAEEFSKFIVFLSKMQNVSGQNFFVESRIII
jgi:3-oxoacyl-[acyl-carrier protein] reductase